MAKFRTLHKGCVSMTLCTIWCSFDDAGGFLWNNSIRVFPKWFDSCTLAKNLNSSKHQRGHLTEGCFGLSAWMWAAFLNHVYKVGTSEGNFEPTRQEWESANNDALWEDMFHFLHLLSSSALFWSFDSSLQITDAVLVCCAVFCQSERKIKPQFARQVTGHSRIRRAVPHMALQICTNYGNMTLFCKS